LQLAKSAFCGHDGKLPELPTWAQILVQPCTAQQQVAIKLVVVQLNATEWPGATTVAANRTVPLVQLPLSFQTVRTTGQLSLLVKVLEPPDAKTFVTLAIASKSRIRYFFICKRLKVKKRIISTSKL